MNSIQIVDKAYFVKLVQIGFNFTFVFLFNLYELKKIKPDFYSKLVVCQFDISI